jgi:hypothetical protein
MRALGLGLFVALIVACLARADDGESGAKANNEENNAIQEWIATKGGALRAGWPRDASGHLIYGWVILDCSTDANGRASGCSVKSSKPTNPVLEKAALALASLYSRRDKNGPPRPLNLSVTTDSDPDWLRKPNLDQMAAVFPSKAGGRAGSALVVCTVKTDGLLRACRIAQETPPGLGFGPAALMLAPSFLMKPAIRDGQPVESEVTIPVNFGETGAGSGAPSITVVTTPAWDKTPTIPEILAELDKKVGDKFAEGKVVFQCTVSRKTGHLNDCITLNTSPGMAGFTPAARSLTSKFEVDKQYLASAKNEVRVNLAFSFPDMQSEAWSKRYLTHPVWLRTISPDPNQPVFPEDAAKAGLKTGSATVDCVMSASGALTNCAVVSESNPGLGFGEMAKKIAELFVANPWTEDGLPADGAHVRMPIRMDYVPPADAPSAAAAPTPTPATKP